MKFLVDAQLPRRLARRLGEAGHDAVHTLDLPSGTRTTDAEICAVADRERRVVVTKDEMVARAGVSGQIDPSGRRWMVIAAFESAWPHTTRFVQEDGWVELGYDDWNRSFIRAVNGGGMIWEGEYHYTSIDAALRALEAGLATWYRDQCGA